MKIVSSIVISLIKFYQATVSSLLGGGKCRFYPTCSEYTVESIKKHGLIYGPLLGLARICRCGPWSTSGYDPVPESENVGIRIWLGKLFGRTSKG